MTRLPIVGFPCDRRSLGKHPFHLVGEKYLTAVRDGSQALPLLIPVMEPPLAVPPVLDSIDGLLFTGSPSNVAPKHYGGPPPREGVLQDEHRDATSLPLLKGAQLLLQSIERRLQGRLSRVLAAAFARELQCLIQPCLLGERLDLR